MAWAFPILISQPGEKLMKPKVLYGGYQIIKRKLSEGDYQVYGYACERNYKTVQYLENSNMKQLNDSKTQM